MKKLKLLLILTLFVNTLLVAQETEEETKHLITGALGYTFIPSGSSHDSQEEGAFVPSLGLDYFYSINSKWEIGIMTDLELGEYLILKKELNRENAFLIAAIASYSLTKHLNISAGGGIEFEKHHNLGVLRIGTEYTINLKKGWLIAPGLFFDFKEGIDTWSLSLGFGREF